MTFRWTTSWGILAILVAAFLLRAGAAVYVQRKVDSYNIPNKVCLIDGDATGYWELAQAIVKGHRYQIYEPPRRLLRMPGFPAMVAAGIKIFGEHLLPIRLMLAALGTLGCWFIYLLGAELFNRRVGLWAAALTAFSPPMIVFSVLLLSELPFATMVAFSLWLFAKLARSNTRVAGFHSESAVSEGIDRSAVCCPVEKLCATLCCNDYSIALFAGLGAGFATLVRPTWLLIAPAFCVPFVFMARNRGRSLLQCLVLLSGLTIALTPWTLRNHRVTGHLIPTTLWVGASMYDGLHPGATGSSDMKFVETDGIYATHSEYDADKYYREAARKFVFENPRRAFELGLIKLGRYWNPLPNAEQFRSWYIGLALACTFLPACLLAAVGFWQVRGNPWCWMIPLSAIFYFSMVHTVFVGSVRYRLPAEGPLMILSAVGLLHLFSRPSQTTTP